MRKQQKRKYCEYCGSPLEKYLSVKSAAELLDCSEEFFRKRILNREIGFAKIGRLIRIPYSEILKMMDYFETVDDTVKRLLR